MAVAAASLSSHHPVGSSGHHTAASSSNAPQSSHHSPPSLPSPLPPPHSISNAIPPASQITHPIAAASSSHPSPSSSSTRSDSLPPLAPSTSVGLSHVSGGSGTGGINSIADIVSSPAFSDPSDQAQFEADKRKIYK